MPQGAGGCSGCFWGNAPSPPNPPRAPSPLTAGVKDDLQVPVVAVGLGQGDAGGGGRAGPGVGVGSQGMGRALQPCGEEEAAGQPLTPPAASAPTRWAPCLCRTWHRGGGRCLPALMGLTGPVARSVSPPTHTPFSPIRPLHRVSPGKEAADPELPEATCRGFWGGPSPGVAMGKGLLCVEGVQEDGRGRGLASS